MKNQEKNQKVVTESLVKVGMALQGLGESLEARSQSFECVSSEMLPEDEKLLMIHELSEVLTDACKNLKENDAEHKFLEFVGTVGVAVQNLVETARADAEEELG